MTCICDFHQNFTISWFVTVCVRDFHDLCPRLSLQESFGESGRNGIWALADHTTDNLYPPRLHKCHATLTQTTNITDTWQMRRIKIKFHTHLNTTIYFNQLCLKFSTVWNNFGSKFAGVLVSRKSASILRTSSCWFAASPSLSEICNCLLKDKNFFSLLFS